jgi:putative ABC transport system ATP-binding protein
MSLLELKNVSYSYNSRYQTVDAMKDVSCQFEESKTYAIVGKSGSGKSTMLSLLAGLDLPHSGQVLYEGAATSDMDLNRYRRECAAVIYQNFRLFPLLTVLENIMYPMQLRGIHGGEARETAKALAQKVSLPETVLNRFPGMISGGEQQRVAIARALTMRSRLILADEPTGNLDSENSEKIIDIFIRLAHEDGYCVIIATHDLGIMQRMDEVLRIRDGAIHPYE